MVVARRGCGANGDDESDEPDTNGVVDGIEKVYFSGIVAGTSWRQCLEDISNTDRPGSRC